jgi:hypothetical protein
MFTLNIYSSHRSPQYNSIMLWTQFPSPCPLTIPVPSPHWHILQTYWCAILDLHIFGRLATGWVPQADGANAECARLQSFVEVGPCSDAILPELQQQVGNLRWMPWHIHSQLMDSLILVDLQFWRKQSLWTNQSFKVLYFKAARDFSHAVWLSVTVFLPTRPRRELPDCDSCHGHGGTQRAVAAEWRMGSQPPKGEHRVIELSWIIAMHVADVFSVFVLFFQCFSGYIYMNVLYTIVEYIYIYIFIYLFIFINVFISSRTKM